MRLEQFEYLAAITEHGSLRRAAEHLHVSQPALSEAVSRLERELGVTLLERHRSGARISRQGLELLPRMMDVVAAAGAVRVAAGRQSRVERVIRIGTVNAGTNTTLVPAIQACRAVHGGITVDVRTMLQRDLEKALSEGALDLGLVNLMDGDDTPPDLERVTLRRGRPVAVLPAGHPLTSLDEVGADDLRPLPFIGMRPGYLMHRFAHRLFGTEPPATWHSADGAEMGKLLVADGLGTTILPDYSVIGDPVHRAGLIEARPIAGDSTAVTMALLLRRVARVPPALTAFIQALQREAVGEAP